MRSQIDSTLLDCVMKIFSILSKIQTHTEKTMIFFCHCAEDLSHVVANR